MADTTAPVEDGSVTFHVKTSGNQKWTLTLPLSTTALDLKNKLSTDEYANVPATSQRLIYSGKVLKDNDTLATYNVKEGNTMHLVKSAASNQRQAPASQSTTSQTIPNAGTPQNTGVPQNLAAGTGNDPLAGLTGARYAGFAGLPSLDSLAHPPSQEEMINRLSDPNFAQQMNEALQNPQMIDMMVNMNPQLRAMGPQARQMLQSEQFRRMMTNPEALRSMMQLQNAMGGDPFGGARGMGGGQEAFPAPGITNPAEQTTGTEGQGQGQTQQQQQQQQQQQNPFAALLGMGGPGGAAGAGANPFGVFGMPGMGMPGQTPSTTGTDSANPAGNAESQNQNPFQGYQPPPWLLGMLGNGGGAGAGAGGFGGFTPPPQDTRPPEERYSTQLRQLNEMGFHDFDRNIQALSRSGGDVNGALEWLFSQPQ